MLTASCGRAKRVWAAALDARATAVHASSSAAGSNATLPPAALPSPSPPRVHVQMGLTLCYRLCPPFNAPLKSVYAPSPATQTVADLRKLIAVSEVPDFDLT
jgi:hypothetical protein